MASFISVGSVHAGSDKAVLKVISSTESSFYVTSVVRIDIYSVISSAVLGSLDKALDNRIAVRATTVLGADGYLLFCAGKAFSHAAHIDGNGLCAALWNASASAVANLFENSDMCVKGTLWSDLVVLDVLGKAKKDSNTKFIVKEAGFDVSALSYSYIWLKADNIAY